MSGVVGVDVRSGALTGDTIQSRTRQVLHDRGVVLRAGGATLAALGDLAGTVSAVSAVSSRGAHVVLTVVGVVALVTGAIWVGQGLNLIPGSFMTGDRTWLAIGLLVGVVGIVLVALGVRGAGRRRRD